MPAQRHQAVHVERLGCCDVSNGLFSPFGSLGAAPAYMSVVALSICGGSPASPAATSVADAIDKKGWAWRLRCVRRPFLESRPLSQSRVEKVGSEGPY